MGQDRGIEWTPHPRFQGTVDARPLQNHFGFVTRHIDVRLQVDRAEGEGTRLVATQDVMLPRFSMASRRLTITFSRAMRSAPWPRVTVIIIGRNSGVSPTAS